MADARAPWWVITGAAAALHGVSGRVSDVDILLDPGDAADLLGDGAAPGAPSDRYRSAVFGRVGDLPLAVELMAGFELCVEGEWQPVTFATREAIAVDDATLFVPSRAELAALLTRIGRPKDRARAASLTRFTLEAGPSRR